MAKNINDIIIDYCIEESIDKYADLFERIIEHKEPEEIKEA